MWCTMPKNDPPARSLACVLLSSWTCRLVTALWAVLSLCPSVYQTLGGSAHLRLAWRGATFLKRQHGSMSKLFAGLSSSCCRRRFLALPVSHSRCCGEQVIKSSWCKHGHGSTSTLNVAVPPMTALLSLPHVFVSHMSTYEQKHCVLT